jgi:opacity protein-like surface antigen
MKYMCRRLRYATSVLLLVPFSPLIRAQETPAYEIFVGPAYTREDITDARFVNGKLEDRYINAIGWRASATGNATSWLGAVFDFSGSFSNPRFSPADLGLSGASPIVTANTSTVTYLFGPRFTFRGRKHITPFAEVLAGPATFRFSSSDIGLTKIISTTAFASAMGGGVDFPLNSVVTVRLIQVDYIISRFRELGIDPNTGLPVFSGPTRTQNNARASVGVVFNIGKR